MPHSPSENGSPDSVIQLDALGEEQLLLLIEELNQRPADSSLPDLETLSTHRNAVVRKSVAIALASFDYVVIASILLRLLSDHNDEVREAATSSLGQFRLPDTLPLLSRMVRDKSDAVRLASLMALWQLRDKASTDVLFMCAGLLLDESPVNACTALQVIEDLRATAIADQAEKVIDNVRRVHPALYKATLLWPPLNTGLPRPKNRDQKHKVAGFGDRGDTSPDDPIGASSGTYRQ
jgi:HEAT repeat protein